jgi:hypothetical protein
MFKRRMLCKEWVSRNILAHRWNYSYPLVFFLGLRLWFSFWAGVALHFVPPPAYASQLYWGMTPLTGGWDQVLWAPWQRWDTIWYTMIAERGYSANELSTAFFPLFPALIKVVALPLGGNSVAASMVIASFAALICFVLLYYLAAEEFGEHIARRTILCLTVFPTTFFLFAGYTESLFLALTLGSYVCARAHYWGWVSILGGLAGLTRFQGIFLFVPLAIEFIQQYRRGQVSLSRGINLTLVLVGGLAYGVFWAWRFQDPLAWLHVQSYWRRFVWPWEPILASASVLFTWSNGLLSLYNLPDLVITLLFLGLTIRGFQRLSPTLAAYMTVLVVPPLFNNPLFVPYLPLASISRYLLMAFPGFFLLGQVASESLWQKLLMTSSFLLETFGLILFVAWIFVG